MPDPGATNPNPLTDAQKKAVSDAFKMMVDAGVTRGDVMTMLDQLAANIIWTMSDHNAFLALLATEIHNQHVHLFIELYMSTEGDGDVHDPNKQ